MTDSAPARRAETLAALRSEAFDLIVIGGGITGAGIARDASLRGLRVALLEKNDLASGTSSQSSKLLHGGVRYLEQWAFGLVMESIRERDALSTNAAHLARPLPFIFPIYEHDRYGPLLVNAGMWLYDAFAMFRSDRRHRMLDVKALREREPALLLDGMRAATLYYDCMTNDGRLCLETALDAVEHGARVLTRAEVTELILEPDPASNSDSNGDADEHVQGVLVRDRLDPEAEPFEVRGAVTVSATGPWTDALIRRFRDEDRPLLRPTKGVHIVLPADRLPVEHAVVLRSVDDQRVMFAIPWRERTIIGTTDTDDEAGPDACRATGEDVDYLLRTAAHYFPEQKLERADVISTWAGLRPLLNSEGMDPSEVSREHEIRELRPGLLAIFGGKLTTYRLMAEQLVDRTGLTKVRSQTTDRPLPGAAGEAMRRNPEGCAARLADERSLAADIAEHLTLSYGDRAGELLDLAAEQELAPERMIPDLPFIWPEVLWAARRELALNLEDVLRRRMMVLLKDRDQGLEVAPRCAELLQAELGWTDERREAELEAYRAAVALTRAWRDEVSAGDSEAAAAAPSATGAEPDTEPESGDRAAPDEAGQSVQSTGS